MTNENGNILTTDPETHTTTGPKMHTIDISDESSNYVVAMPESVVKWVNNNSEYPDFEINFIGESPLGQSAVVTATNHNSVTTNVSGKEGVYLYSVHYKGSGKKCKRSQPREFVITNCKNC